MMTSSFTVHSGIGRCRFGPSKSPSTSSSARVSHLAEDTREPSAQETVRRQTEQLTQLKDQYVRLRSQFQDEQKESTVKLLNLQRELRAEQKLIDELEAEIAGVSAGGTVHDGEGKSAAAIIEQIWQLMQAYREAVQTGKDDDPDPVYLRRGENGRRAQH